MTTSHMTVQRPHGIRRRILPALAALPLVLAACGGDDEETNGAAGDGDTETEEEVTETEEDSTDTAEAPEARTLEVGHVYETDYPLHRCGVAEMNERFEAEGTGLEFEIYPASQLGSEAEMLEQVISGQLEAALIGPTFMADYHEPLRILDAAYVFADVEDLFDTLSTDAMQQEFEVVRQEQGVRVLDVWLYGVRHITGDRPVRTPEDLDGVTLRVPDSQIYVQSAEAIGSTPNPLAFSEAYLALQQGVVNAVEGPAAATVSQGFDEVADYFSLTGHIMATTALVINDEVWETLDGSHQEALSTLAVEQRDAVTACLDEMDQEAISEWEETGALEVVDDVDIDAFQDAAAEYFGEGFEWSDLYLELTGRG